MPQTKLLFILSFLFLTSCNPKAPRAPNPNSKTYMFDIMSYFTHAQASLLNQQYHMTTGSSGGSTTNPIQNINLGFEINRHLTLDEGRAILFDCISQILTNANQDQMFQAYLPDEGLTPFNLKCSIFVKTREETYHPEIAAFCFYKGKFTYYSNEKNHPDGIFHYQINESYEEARDILIEQGKISGDDIIQP